jgi:hypothetical protein
MTSAPSHSSHSSGTVSVSLDWLQRIEACEAQADDVRQLHIELLQTQIAETVSPPAVELPLVPLCAQTVVMSKSMPRRGMRVRTVARNVEGFCTLRGAAPLPRDPSRIGRQRPVYRVIVEAYGVATVRIRFATSASCRATTR